MCWEDEKRHRPKSKPKTENAFSHICCTPLTLVPCEILSLLSLLSIKSKLLPFASDGGLGTGFNSGGAVRAAIAGASVSATRPWKSGGAPAECKRERRRYILVHAVIYFGLITILLIAVGVHVYTG
ncbi:hypothetical protein HAX54_049243 [Datura stramonium]|uniref:Transmembrane protein n=1 Tax=Datura stramonium TaxID=4076 RepID=A0ABS8WP79_DATST|nr:hypothetical protein [Datura stramonium]